MSVSIDICTVSESLDLYGPPDPSAAYSLSGHVSISIRSPFSLFERRRPVRLLLQSLVLTFEGQTEIITPRIGYSGLRLCSVSRELAPVVPLELSNEGHEDDPLPARWDVIFNIPIPGWLPASSKYGVEDVGTSYALYATAKFVSLDDHSSGWSFAALCTPFRSRTKVVETIRKVTIRRFLTTPSTERINIPAVTYLVNCPKKVAPEGPHIPPDVLSKVQVLASVPEYVRLTDDTISLILRLRTKDLDEAECKKLQVVSFSVDIFQRERFRQSPSSSFTDRFKIPPPSMQPPEVPLRQAHPFSLMYDAGMYLPLSTSDTSARSFSLLPPEESGQYALAGDNYVFANDATPTTTPTWYTLEATIPFLTEGIAADRHWEWAGLPAIRPTESGPLSSFTHDLSIALTLSYDLPSGEKVQEKLDFVIPLHFGHAPPQLTPPTLTPLGMNEITGTHACAPSLPVLTPYVPTLPPYSQLYDDNGDRKIDYSIPLPLYTEEPISEYATAISDIPAQ
ncbi:hypothetical protein AX16_008844 [Volvariella volvacea WC 439]|nr:hypothetical protein AX16_008844 [Volvariella volvacea WC 439]